MLNILIFRAKKNEISLFCSEYGWQVCVKCFDNNTLKEDWTISLFLMLYKILQKNPYVLAAFSTNHSSITFSLTRNCVMDAEKDCGNTKTLFM